MNDQSTTLFPAARYIKEIGRGKNGARSLSRKDACDLYTAMLDGRVSDLAMGAILLALRIKGESLDEIAGFLDAAETHVQKLDAPAASAYAPVLIPSYNGARNKPNLTPLLALLLAREGVPVLVHGVLNDTGRVTTAEILLALKLELSDTAQHAQQQFAQQQPAFMAIDHLSPAMTRLLAYRRQLGVRSSTHTLVKILQPFRQAALRLVSYTHPEYASLMREYFMNFATQQYGDALLMRATEGETVANTGRAQQIDWIHAGLCTTLVERDAVLQTSEDLSIARDADSTAHWIQAVLRGEAKAPVNITAQVEHCKKIAQNLCSG